MLSSSVGRTALRLHTSSACATKYHTDNVNATIRRVSALYTTLATAFSISSSFSQTLKFQSRSYATQGRPVSRPKAHTGQTTSSRKIGRPKAVKPATTDAATQTTTTVKVTKPKTKKNAKSKVTKTKKPAKKAVKKATKKPVKKPAKKTKPVKKLTEEEKKKLLIKELRQTALKPPKALPIHVYPLVFKDVIGQAQNKDMKVVAKTASQQYKELLPEQIEHYNHIIVANRAANEAARKEWLSSLPPATITAANSARLRLRRMGIHTPLQAHKLTDERHIKQPLTAYTTFCSERFSSGDFHGIKIPDASKLIGREWRELTPERKAEYEARQQEAREAYVIEKKKQDEEYPAPVKEKKKRASSKRTSAVDAEGESTTSAEEAGAGT
ncbi:hypothetical protein MMC25_008250 [Agyrium rufum]|nr:hypothetical protein [Agyrium rufum]